MHSEETLSQEDFPVEDYGSRRREYTSTASQVALEYRPATTPAWDKHRSEMPSKPERFSKLTKWDDSANRIKAIVMWVALLATAVAAAPIVMRLLH